MATNTTNNSEKESTLNLAISYFRSIRANEKRIDEFTKEKETSRASFIRAIVIYRYLLLNPNKSVQDFLDTFSGNIENLSRIMDNHFKNQYEQYFGGSHNEKLMQIFDLIIGDNELGFLPLYIKNLEDICVNSNNKEET